MFPWTSYSTCPAASPCTRLSRAPSTTSESDFHRRFCLPQLVRSVDILGPLFPDRDGGGSPRCHDASISAHAVLLDPAGVSSDHRLCGRLLLPSRFSTLSASGCVTRLNRFTCVTAWTSLGLRLTHVVTFMSPKLDSWWGGSSLSGAGVSPAGSAGLSLAHRKISRDADPPPSDGLGRSECPTCALRRPASGSPPVLPVVVRRFR